MFVYGMGGVFVLLLVLAFLTPILLVRGGKPNLETADAAKTTAEATVADQPAAQLIAPASQPPGRAGGADLPPGPAPLVSGGQDSDIIRQFPPKHTSRIRRLAISRDGKRALSFADDTKMFLWNMETGRPLKQVDFERHCAQLAFLPSGNEFLILYMDGSVHLWDLEKGRSTAQFGEIDPSSMIYQIALSADGHRFLASGSSVRAAAAKDSKPTFLSNWSIWDIATRHKLKEVSFPEDCTCAAWSGDERFVAAATNPICLWDVEQGQELTKLGGHAAGVMSVAFSPDGNRLLSGGGQDRMVRLWDLKAKKPIHTFTVDGGPIKFVAFAPDGHRAIAFSEGVNMMKSWIWILDLDGGHVTHKLGGEGGVEGFTNDIALSPRDGSILLGGLTIVQRKWP